jgi:hypothetical protein
MKEEVMSRQILNVVTTLLITAFAGFGLTASAQDPSSYEKPKTSVVQPVAQQPVAQQPVTQQPVTQQPVAQQVMQTGGCAQPTSCHQVGYVAQQASACVQPTSCVVQTVAYNSYSANLEDLVKRIEKGADNFYKDFKDSLSEDCLKCVTFNADAYKDQVKEFERATDRLRKDYGDECDVSGQVYEVLRLAGCVSAYIDPCTLCPEAVAEWNSLRADLDALASAYCTSVAWQQPISLQPPQAVCIQAVSCPVSCQVTK